MRAIQKSFLIIFVLIISTNCGVNFFYAASSKDSDAAHLYQAEKHIDSQEYLDAITELSAISAEYGTNYKVRRAFASAYAGACGMEFFTFFTSLSSFTGGSTLFKFMMNAFTDKSPTPSYCLLAENKIKELGATDTLREAAVGSKEPNFFMAILAMAKVGSILRTNLDLDGANSLGDGTADATADFCADTSNASPDLTNDEVFEVATGFGLLLENLDDLLGGSGDVTTALDALELAITAGLCSNGAGKCVIKDDSEYDALTVGEQAEIIDTYRDLLKNSATGLGGAVCAGDLCCP